MSGKLSALEESLQNLYKLEQNKKIDFEIKLAEKIVEKEKHASKRFYIAKPILGAPKLICNEKNKTLTTNSVILSFTTDMMNTALISEPTTNTDTITYEIFLSNDSFEPISQVYVFKLGIGENKKTTLLIDGKIANDIVYLAWRYSEDPNDAVQEFIPLKAKIEFINDFGF